MTFDLFKVGASLGQGWAGRLGAMVLSYLPGAGACWPQNRL